MHPVYAWGDESVRITANPSAYLLAATIVDPEESIDGLMRVKPANAKKLHWRDMTRHNQSLSLAALSCVRQATTVVVGTPLPKKKQERGRRKCLECLLPELEARGVAVLVLESRDDEKNKKDRDLLFAMRRKGQIESIDIIHRRAENEPLLWIPDQILGAYGDVLCGNPGSKTWLEQWKKTCERIEVLEVAI